MQSRTRSLVTTGVLAAAVFATGMLGLAARGEHTFATPIWPPSGIGLAALVLGGYRMLPGVLIGLVAMIAVTSDAPILAIPVAAIVTLEWSAGAYLLRKLQFDTKLERPRDVLVLLGVALTAPLVASVVGIQLIYAIGGLTASQVAMATLGWWMTGLVSMLLVASLVFSWHARSVRLVERGASWREALALAVVFLALGTATFVANVDVLDRFARPYVMFLPVIWAAVRFGPHGATLLAAGTVAIAQVGLLQWEREIEIWSVQPYFAVLTATGLFIAAVVASHRSAERRMTAICDAAIDAIVTIDSAGRVTEMNHRAEQLFGYAECEVIGRELATIMMPPDLRDGDELHRLLQDSQSILGSRTRMPAMRKDGTQFPAELSVVRVPVPGPPLFTGFIRDATLQVRAEERARRAKEDLERQVNVRTAELSKLNHELQLQRDQHAVAQQLAHVGSFDFDVASGKLLWSEELTRIYGLAPSDAEPTFDSFLARIHPDDRDTVQRKIALAIAELEPFTFEERIIRPTGEVRTLLSHGRVVGDAYGRPVRVVGSCQDITERRHAEEQRDRLVGIVAFSDDAIIGLDLAFDIQTWNQGATKLFGYAPSEMIGRPAALLVPAKQVLDQRQRLSAIAKGKHVDQYEWTHVRADGSEFTASVTISAIRDERGRLIGIAKVLRDVSRRVAIETQLRNSLKEKEVLLREIHHRVKNNMQVISSFLNLQLAKLANADARRAVSDSQSRIQSMALVHQLLYQSKDLASIHFADYLRALASKLVTTYRPQNDVHVHIADSEIRLDIERAIPCGLVVNELLTNALAHAFPDGRKGNVWISLREEGETYVLTIADDGIGIPPELSIDKAATFGLKIARTLGQQLGGTLTVEPSDGTIAQIIFPVSNQQRSAA